MSLCIQTNITRFQEIPGRRRTFTRGQFDVLSCVFIGPTRLKDQFLPAVDSQSTAVGLPYPFMLATTVTDVDKPGALTEVSLTYKGHLLANSNISPLTISTRQVETSGSFPTRGQIQVTPGSPLYTNRSDGHGGTLIVVTGTVGAVEKIGIWTTNVRYLSKQAIIKYQAVGRPGSPIQGGIGTSLASYTILSEDRAQLTGVNQTDGKPTVNLTVTSSFGVICTDFSVEQIAATLFDCSETWEFKYINSVNWGLS